MIIKNQKGMTLVELLVSMGIFAVVMTMTVGFFITMQKMQMMYRDRANLQQEGRVAMEVFSRFTREVKTIQFTEGSDNLCPNNGLSQITLEMLDGARVGFICDGTGAPKRLKMGACAPIPPAKTCTLPDGSTFSPVSSDQISVESLVIRRVSPATYPKALKYEMTVSQFRNGSAATGEGEKLIFSGYMVMKNEL